MSIAKFYARILVLVTLLNQILLHYHHHSNYNLTTLKLIKNFYWLKYLVANLLCKKDNSVKLVICQHQILLHYHHHSNYSITTLKLIKNFYWLKYLVVNLLCKKDNSVKLVIFHYQILLHYHHHSNYNLTITRSILFKAQALIKKHSDLFKKISQVINCSSLFLINGQRKLVGSTR